jgi:GMP synthase PP-ATPase subunit
LSPDARSGYGAGEARVRELTCEVLRRLTRRITAIPGVNRCRYDLTPKPPTTVE